MTKIGDSVENGKAYAQDRLLDRTHRIRLLGFRAVSDLRLALRRSF